MHDPDRTPSSSVLQSARREALFVAALWVLSCVYTVGYAALFAYRPETAPRLIFGMPTWVFWGVIAPWSVCTLVTCWYALRGMRDEDLGDEAAPVPAGDSTGGSHG